MNDSSQKKRRIVYITSIVVLGIGLGILALFLAKTLSARGDTEVMATVRLADGTTEDEIFITALPVTKRVSGKSVMLNQTQYLLKSAKVSDTEVVSFDGCVLRGVYEPERCTSEGGTPYWVTLTAIE